jgi:hypothetical protein
MYHKYEPFINLVNRSDFGNHRNKVNKSVENYELACKSQLVNLSSFLWHDHEKEIELFNLETKVRLLKGEINEKSFQLYVDEKKKELNDRTEIHRKFRLEIDADLKVKELELEKVMIEAVTGTGQGNWKHYL